MSHVSSHGSAPKYASAPLGAIGCAGVVSAGASLSLLRRKMCRIERYLRGEDFSGFAGVLLPDDGTPGEKRWKMLASKHRVSELSPRSINSFQI